ncbi:MAG: hypothetical protein EP343_10455 [Deltaproteobacteria bacterium]|nr:MAG: hypothetical protein EP343_10455 [Deltaproteobacteria bacterium]
MNCSEIRRFLHAYIDEEFGEREQIEFELHLRQCSHCRDEVNYYRALRRTLRQKLPSKVAPMRLENMIRDTLHTEEQIQRGWLSFSMATVGAFCLALFVFLWSPSVDERNGMMANARQPLSPTMMSSIPASTTGNELPEVPNTDSNAKRLTKQQKAFMRNVIRVTRAFERQGSRGKAFSEEGNDRLQNVADTQPTISLRNCEFHENNNIPMNAQQRAEHQRWCRGLPSSNSAKITPAAFSTP